MSERKEEDKRENNVSKKNNNVSDELALMRFNYENLDRAVWKAHQMSWFMTSIFVPLIFAGLGYLLKELDDIGVFGVIAGAIVVIGVTWFWYAFTRILAGYNKQRFKQLRKIEDMFDKYYPEELVQKEKQFVQYRSSPEQRRKLRFKNVTLWFAIFLTFVSTGAAMVRILLWVRIVIGEL